MYECHWIARNSKPAFIKTAKAGGYVPAYCNRDRAPLNTSLTVTRTRARQCTCPCVALSGNRWAQAKVRDYSPSPGSSTQTHVSLGFLRYAHRTRREPWHSNIRLAKPPLHWNSCKALFSNRPQSSRSPQQIKMLQILQNGVAASSCRRRFLFFFYNTQTPVSLTSPSNNRK